VLHYLWSSVRFALIKLHRQQHDISLAPELTTTGNETVVERLLDAQALLAHVRKLVTLQDWEVLWLRFGQEHSPREIAVRLGIPVEHVYLTLASAKRRLRSDPQLRTLIDGDNQS
jgi:DNA-directed RNA polymerase specialized sigma24 family protein